jgi:hypothetical protein
MGGAEMNRKTNHPAPYPFRLVGKSLELPMPREHRPGLLPVPPLAPAPFNRSQNDQHVVREFRQKMRKAEELITKLAFSLREIQGVWHKA